MGQDRLSSLALTHIHYDVPVDVNQTVHYFCSLISKEIAVKENTDQTATVRAVKLRMRSVTPVPPEA